MAKKKADTPPVVPVAPVAPTKPDVPPFRTFRITRDRGPLEHISCHAITFPHPGLAVFLDFKLQEIEPGIYGLIQATRRAVQGSWVDIVEVTNLSAQPEGFM